MPAIFFQSLIIGYSGAVMPGTLFIYTVDKSIRYGTKSGILVSIGQNIITNLDMAIKKAE